MNPPVRYCVHVLSTRLLLYTPTISDEMKYLCVLHRHRDNPLYEITSAALRDSNHVTSTGACSFCCLLILVLISLVVAAAAVAVAIVAVTMQQLTGACLSCYCHHQLLSLKY